MSRVKRVPDRRAMERATDEYITKGYRLTSEGETSTRLKERDWGDSGIHLLIALLTVWWSLGFFNALYAIYSYVTAEEVLITVEDGQEPADSDAERDGNSDKRRDSHLAATERVDRDHGSPDSTPNGRGRAPDSKREAPAVDRGEPGGSVGPAPSEGQAGEPNPQFDGRERAGEFDDTDDVHRSDALTTATMIQYGLLQSVSLFVAGLVLLTIFTFYVGEVGPSVALLALPALAATVALRYVAIYHPFSTVRYRRIAVAPVLLAFAATGAVWLVRLQGSIDPGAIGQVLGNDSVRFGSAQFLPRWWIGSLVLVAGIALLLGSLRTRDFSTYPWPDGLRQVATSPVAFGLLCAFFGLWSVLFVGISIQRVLVFAPIFEELLKFGVAILIGSALFGRSMLARVGVAIVVGALFGLVEHATTYPMESDAVYLFRTVFHAMLTVLSVSVYTAFDEMNEDGYRWIAPAYSILLHFFYNAFAVLSSIVAVIAFGAPSTPLVLGYGAGGIAIMVAILGLVAANRTALVAIYSPVHHLLSDLA